MVFIKMKIVPQLKFHPKLNEMPRQHQSLAAMCHIITFLKLKQLKIIYFFLNKNFGEATPTHPQEETLSFLSLPLSIVNLRKEKANPSLQRKGNLLYLQEK